MPNIRPSELYGPSDLSSYCENVADASTEARVRGDLSELLRLLADTDRVTRLGAAQELGKLGDPAGVAPLIRTLQANDDLLRNSAIKALARIAQPEVIPALLETATTDPAWSVRVCAIDALATLDNDEGLAMLEQLAADPVPLIATASRYFNPRPPFSTRRSAIRHTKDWAVKRLRELKEQQDASGT